MIKNITKVKWAPIRQLPIYYLPMGEWWRKPAHAQTPYASLSDSRRLSLCYLIVSKILSLQLRETGFMNAEKLCLWNPESGKILLVESGILGFGIWNTAQGTRNPPND